MYRMSVVKNKCSCNQKKQFKLKTGFIIIVSVLFLSYPQMVVGLMYIVIGSLNINRTKDQTAAVILNDVILVLVFVISLINVIISGFGIEHSSQPLRLLEKEPLQSICTAQPITTYRILISYNAYIDDLKLTYVSQSQVVAAMLAIILTRISLYNSARHRSIANALTHISLGLVFVALFCDVIKMNFGLDPAVPFDKPDTP